MTEVRLHTNIRRMRPLKVYVLEPSVSAVPCLAGGVAKEESFAVQLYLSENNKERQPAKAFIRYSACLGDACQLPVASAEAVSSVTVDTGKRAGKVFDKYVIEAYKVEQDKETVLATLSVGTVCDGDVGDNGPLLVPYGSWDAQRTYRSTSDVKIFVERKRMYYVLTKLNADCVGIDPATDVKNEYWRLMDYVEYMFVNAMVAEFGKIGSTVFAGHHTLSQHGVDAQGNPVNTEHGYENFGKLSPDGKPLFTPNVLIDWLTGRIEALEMIIKGNSVFGGHLEGTEGTFKRLECTDWQGRKIVLDPSPDGVDKPSVSLYDAEGKKVCNVSFDDKLTRSATIELFRYDSKGNETNSCLLHSNGIVKGTMPGKSFTLTPSGLTYNRVIDGVETAWLTYPSERKVVALTGGNYNVGRLDYFIRTINGTNNVYLPNASTCPGRVIYIKKTSGGDYTYLKVSSNVPGGIKDENNSTSVKQYEINQNVALFVVSDATDWIVFYCG